MTTTPATTSVSISLCPTQNVCSNSGTCYIVSGYIRCVCQLGYTGVFCETPTTTTTTSK